MTEPTTRLLRDAENYLSALHGSVARHDNLAANYGCAGCERRDKIAAELRAAAPAGPAPATDRSAAPTDWIDGHPQLEAIAAAVWERCEHHDSGLVIDDPRNIAVAALAAVLPPPDQQAAECPQCNDTGACNGGPCPLRRLAGEAQQDEAAPRPAACRCHSREGLTPQQHENDCPLAQPTREAQQGPTQDGEAAAPDDQASLAAGLRAAADEIAGIDFHPNARARSLDIADGLARRLLRMADELQTAPAKDARRQVCGAREPEPRTGTRPCVLPAGHGGTKHQDKWTNQWPIDLAARSGQPETDEETDTPPAACWHTEPDTPCDWDVCRQPERLAAGDHGTDPADES
ncbi:hypothetical protein AB0F36_14410 [Streptomyces sp. NPDC029080]|uniref:hypothetical protein n=1 Tax=Streptomyces sp. NPDC029080 TaxID=3155017 RepID=UPI0033C7712A